MLTVMIFHISHKQNEHIMRLDFIEAAMQPGPTITTANNFLEDSNEDEVFRQRKFAADQRL